MQIIYDPKQEIYYIGMAQPEMVTYIRANNTTEAREEFINRMTWLFDEAVNKHLKGSFQEAMLYDI